MWKRLRRLLLESDPPGMPTLAEAQAALNDAQKAHEQTPKLAKKRDEINDVFVATIVQGIIDKKQRGKALCT